MITGCTKCGRKTRQIDASVYAGDYHGGDVWAAGRQCVECGTIFEVQAIGKTKRAHAWQAKFVPPRNDWQEPIL